MKYWAYVKNEILGPYEVEEVKALPDYSPDLLVCPQTPVGEKTEEWRAVSQCPEFSGGTAINSPLMSEQIPDQIETGSLQIDHNFNMSNSGRLNSNRLGQLSPLENNGGSSAINADIAVNQLTRSGRVKASDINWNLAAAQEAAQQQEQPQQFGQQQDMPQVGQDNQQFGQENQFFGQDAQQDPFATQEPQISEQPASGDPFGDIYKDIAGGQETQQAQPSIQPAEGLESMHTMDPSANQQPSIGEMPMQNTMEFSLDNANQNSPLNDPMQQQGIDSGYDFGGGNAQPQQMANPAAVQPQAYAAPAAANMNTDVFSQKIDGIDQKIDMMSQNAITREDFTMAVDPIKMKLDQFDDMFTAIRSSQSQQEADLMAKLNSLEKQLSTLAYSSPKSASSAGNPFQQTVPPASSGNYESVSLTPSSPMQGYESGSSTTASLVPADPADSLKKEENKKKDKKKKEEIKDVGSKAASGNIIVRLFKGIFQLIFSIILLIAIAYGAGVGLKLGNVYNVSPMIPPLIAQYLPQYKNILLPMLLEQQDWDNFNKSAGEPTEGQQQTQEQPQTENTIPENNDAVPSEQQPEIIAEDTGTATAEPDINSIMSEIRSYKVNDKNTIEDRLNAIKGNRKIEPKVNPSSNNPGTYDVDVILDGENPQTFVFSYDPNTKKLTGKDNVSQSLLSPQFNPNEFGQTANQNGNKNTGKQRKARGGRKKAKPAPAPQPDGEYEVSLDD